MEKGNILRILSAKSRVSTHMFWMSRPKPAKNHAQTVLPFPVPTAKHVPGTATSAQTSTPVICVLKGCSLTNKKRSVDVQQDSLFQDKSA